MAQYDDDVDKSDKATRFKEKHSLDSDEEDEDPKYDVLAEDDIEGQEEATIDFDENIQITPFNMREEMEEGHFDTDGTFIFDKTKEIHDNWIDNIDWVKVKHTNPDEANKKRPFEYSDDSDESDEEQRKLDTIETYQEILKILEEGETIAKAIRRLAKNKAKIPSASQRWKNKKQKSAGKTSTEDQSAIDQAMAEQKEMLHLMELADKIVQTGISDIYETPYERIAFTLKRMQEKDKASRLTVAEGMKDDDALDMFAEDFDAKEASKMKGPDGDSDSKENTAKDPNTDPAVFKEPKPPEAPAATSSSEAVTADQGVLWEYKTENTEGAEVKGPFTTSQMIVWSEDGTLGNGVFCRKYQSHGQFYNSSRLDFDLYL